MKTFLSASLALLPLFIFGCEKPAPAPAAPPSTHAHHHSPQAAPTLAGPPSSTSAQLVPVVNALCPILVGQSVGPDKACDRSLVREFHGQKIGFCDPECKATWDQLTDEQRQKYLDEALQLEAKDP